MKPRSVKAKGKALEKWIRDTILAQYPELTTDDVRVTVGSETGADVKLSKKAQDKFPFAIEAKNRQTFKGIYDAYEQARTHSTKLAPLLIIKQNRSSPLVIVDARFFFNLWHDFMKELNDE